MDWSRTFDVLVVGGGNAALCAAITAREQGATVLVLEIAPHAFRGGNSRHTRNIRYVHDRGNDYLTGPYGQEEFWEDLLQVTGGETNERIARLTIRESTNLGAWMERHGCRFQPPLRGTLNLDRTNAFFLGGGKALMNAYYHTAERLGVEIAYDSEVRDLGVDNGRFASAVVRLGSATRSVRAKAVVVAAGGFQANIPWLREHWGPAADNFIIRGTPYDTGTMLRVLLDRGGGAKPVGDPRQCHAVAVDGRSPKFDGGIVTRIDSIPFGILVNKHAQRFYDEGEEFWPKRYAIWGRIVAQQPDQVAYSIVDSKSIDLFIPSVFPPYQADTIPQLAAALELDGAALAKTVSAFNASVWRRRRGRGGRGGTFDPLALDDCSTEGLEPPKSHWARALDTAPYFGYPLRPGITFTYYGGTVNDRAQVVMQDDHPALNVFAAGEIMAGNILGKGYVSGLGMTIGTVFGRIAGREAARYAVSGD